MNLITIKTKIVPELSKVLRWILGSKNCSMMASRIGQHMSSCGLFGAVLRGGPGT